MNEPTTYSLDPAGVAYLAYQIDGITADDTPSGMVDQLLQLQQLRQAVQAAERRVHGELAEAMWARDPQDRMVQLRNGRCVHLTPTRRTAKKRYDNGRLIGRVVNAATSRARDLDEETGELVDVAPEEFAQRAVYLVADCAGLATEGFNAWRTGQLAEHGIAYDDLQTVERGDPYVKVAGL